jgi:hypothetical protein
VRVLRDDGCALAKDSGRLPGRKEPAAAPRRDVACGGPVKSLGCAGAATANRDRSTSFIARVTKSGSQDKVMG